MTHAMTFGVFAVALAACGGVVDDADASVDASSKDVAKSDVQASGACPSSMPANASACSDVDLVCEFGTSWSVSCNVVATCQSDHTWQTESGPSCPSGSACPQAIPTAGDDCAAPASCDYTQGHCICVSSCGGPPPQDAGNHWACNAAPANCPYPRPDLGTPCATSGQKCAYDVGCCGGEDLTCTGGVWRGTATGLCP